MEKINEVGYYESDYPGHKGWYFWDHRGMMMGTWGLPMGEAYDSKEDAEKGLAISKRLNENWKTKKEMAIKFHSTIVQYLDGELAEKELMNALYQLGESIVDNVNPNIDKEDAIQECVKIGLDKIKRFDPTKGKALNYFTTCMLGHLRQLSRSEGKTKLI